MYVCLCSGVTDGQIRKVATEGVCTLRQLRACLGVASQCGRCAQHANNVLDETLSAIDAPEQSQAA